MSSNQLLVDKLIKTGIVQTGDFTLKSGKKSNLYFDLRCLPSHPKLFKEVIQEMGQVSDIDLVCGVPSAGMALATAYSLEFNVPMIWCRKEAKQHGLKRQVEGEYKTGQRVLILEDVVTTGGSILETIQILENIGLVVVQVNVIVDRRENKGSLLLNNIPEGGPAYSVNALLNEFDFSNHQPLYGMQSDIIRIMYKKQSNLILSADVTTCSDLEDLLENVGDKVVIVKIHLDIVEENQQKFINLLGEMAVEHDFIIMEDRKFSDIGNTVKRQYAESENNIIDWAQLVTTHLIMGPGTLQALHQCITDPKYNGIIPVIQASSQGNLMDANYTQKCLEMMETHREVIPGVVCQRGCDIKNNKVGRGVQNYLCFSPGVHLDITQDNLGQQYRTVEDAIVRDGNDLIIVGRGIYEASNPSEAAEKYRKVGWEAYLKKQTMAGVGD